MAGATTRTRRWRTTIPLPNERTEDVIDKLREVAYPMEIVIEIEAEDLWEARGRLDEVFHEISAMTGVSLSPSKPTEVGR